MPIIKPGLIRYRSKRSNVVHQNSLKYGLASPRLDYGANIDSRKRQENLAKIAGRHQIKELSFNFLSSKKYTNQHFLRFASRISNLQQISISLVKGITCDTKSLNLKKLFKKLFSQNKRLFSIKATFIDQEINASLFAKSLSRLRSLKSLDLNFRFYSATSLTPTLHSIAQFLRLMFRRKNWPHLVSQSFAFHLTPDIASEEPLSNAFKTFNQVMSTFKKPHLLDLLFYFIPPSNQVNLNDTANILGSSSDIIALGLGSRCNLDFYRFLDIVKEKNKIRNLNLFLFEQENYKILNFLPDTLKELSSLRVLDLRFELISDVGQLNYFAEKLSDLSHIHKLNLTFAKNNVVENCTLEKISQSILSLKQLVKLVLNCMYQGLDSKVTSQGIVKVFETVGAITGLEELHLNFSYYEHVIDDETVRALWNSLKNLKNLSHLNLELSHNQIGSAGLKGFARVVERLDKLQYLMLGFDGCQWMDSGSIVSLFNRLEGLRILSNLTLHLKCARMDNEFVNAFIKAGYQLRSLNSLQIWFYRSSGDYGSQMISLLEAVKLLQKRLTLEFNCLFIK